MKCYSYFLCLIILVSGFCKSGFTQTNHVETIRDTSGIRILTYNIHHCNPPSEPRKIDVAAIGTVINEQQPDLVALQEVDVFTSRSGGIDQTAELGKITGMHAYFGKAIDYAGGEYGVGVLSKYPVESAEVVKLPNDTFIKAEPRVLLLVKVKIQNKSLFFGITHLDVQTEQNRINQVKKIIEVTDTIAGPVILAGDMNATPESEPLRILETKFNRTCRQCEFTIPATMPTSTIDYILYSGNAPLEIHSLQVVTKSSYPSDHLPVLAVLKWKE